MAMKESLLSHSAGYLPFNPRSFLQSFTKSLKRRIQPSPHQLKHEVPSADLVNKIGRITSFTDQGEACNETGGNASPDDIYNVVKDLCFDEMTPIEDKCLIDVHNDNYSGQCAMGFASDEEPGDLHFELLIHDGVKVSSEADADVQTANKCLAKETNVISPLAIESKCLADSMNINYQKPEVLIQDNEKEAGKEIKNGVLDEESITTGAALPMEKLGVKSFLLYFMKSLKRGTQKSPQQLKQEVVLSAGVNEMGGNATFTNQGEACNGEAGFFAWNPLALQTKQRNDFLSTHELDYSKFVDRRLPKDTKIWMKVSPCDNHHHTIFKHFNGVKHTNMLKSNGDDKDELLNTPELEPAYSITPIVTSPNELFQEDINIYSDEDFSDYEPELCQEDRITYSGEDLYYYQPELFHEDRNKNSDEDFCDYEPELISRYKEMDYNVVKDICFDEGQDLEDNRLIDLHIDNYYSGSITNSARNSLGSESSASSFSFPVLQPEGNSSPVWMGNTYVTNQGKACDGRARLSSGISGHITYSGSIMEEPHYDQREAQLAPPDLFYSQYYNLNVIAA